MPDPSTIGNAAQLRLHLETLKRLRGVALGGRVPRIEEVKQWQSERLQRSYRDLSSIARYKEATSFFMEDLYGTKDFSGRDEAMMRIHPLLTRMLPESAVETAALAIELDALSESLDQRLARALAPGPITVASDAQAYRESSTPKEREHQIALIEAVGERLDRLVNKPMVFQMLKLMHTPAKLAGLSDLQTFLEHGFNSFRSMGGAGDFLATIAGRERAISSRLFSSRPDPFSI